MESRCVLYQNSKQASSNLRPINGAGLAFERGVFRSQYNGGFTRVKRRLTICDPVVLRLRDLQHVCDLLMPLIFNSALSTLRTTAAPYPRTNLYLFIGTYTFGPAHCVQPARPPSSHPP